ncbi:MAG TPA: ATPase [Sphaerochaeta sp.]|nr:ATPase [Sphaerochaeta sp.]
MRTPMRKTLPPSQYLISGFFAIILVGSALLSLPFAHREGIQLAYIDALFTSFSAVCVTGLVTVDVAATFTLFGRAIIAVLILLGGMGFAAVIMSIVLMLGWDVGISQRTLLSEAYNLGTLRGTLVIVKTVVFASVMFQIVGTVLGYLVFRLDYSPLDALGHGLFHAISAFNNAGFDLMGNFDSMMNYRHNVLLNMLTMFLIVSGGLGFFVLSDVFRKRWHFRKFTMHTKIVLSVTAFLIVFGMVVISLVERMDILSALFQSVTARTAGFNTIDTGSLSTFSLFFVVLLMFVGASPGSTGGGIKTTTTFAIWLSLMSLAFGKQPAAFKRRIPEDSLLKAFQVLMLALLTVTIGSLALALFEGQHFSFMQLMFEGVSAFATVGLSTGITTEIGSGAKIVLMVMMFVGRLGPITVATSLKTREARLKHVEERIFIG